ncbi:MAG TPA: efflux RND transporter periplasmic adaptor subunit, partial [Dokdonella sp.]
MRTSLPSALFCVLMLANAAFAQGAADAAKPATASVATIAARQGSLAHAISAWGSVAPAPDATDTLNIQTPGQVARWFVMAGESVRRGQVLLEFSATPAALAAYTQAVSALELAREQRKRAASLLAQQLATRDQWQQADKAVGDAQAALDALHRQQGDRGLVTLKAPYDGIVAALNANQGDTLAAGAPLLVLDRADGLVLAAGVETDALAQIQPGARVRLHPLDGGATLDGRVQRIGAALNPRTRLVDVQIAGEGALRVGAGYRADIAIGEWKGWLLPRDALIGDDDEVHVFQVSAGKAVAIPVRILGEADETTV